MLNAGGFLLYRNTFIYNSLFFGVPTPLSWLLDLQPRARALRVSRISRSRPPASNNYFTCLPPELHAHILGFLPDFTTVFSAVLVHSSIFFPFEDFERQILLPVFCRQCDCLSASGYEVRLPYAYYYSARTGGQVVTSSLLRIVTSAVSQT
jgi:hypothetical protein